MIEENTGGDQTTEENTTTPEATTTESGDNNEGGNDETSSTQPDQPSEEFISAWEEDRLKADKLAQENLELRRKMADSSSDEDEDLSMDEKVDKEIAKREQFSKEQAEIESKSAEREVNFLEKINPFFRENKEAILKLAVDVKAKTLNEAIDIFKKRTTDVNTQDKKTEESTEKKQENKTTETKIDKPEDMSIQDIYQSAL